MTTAIIHDGRAISELFTRFGSDKGTAGHDYGPAYAAILGAPPASVKRLVEIGVFRGNSLLAWRELYPEASIVGVDIDIDQIDSTTRSRLADNKIQLISGDAGSAAVAEQLKSMPLPQLIIDDGSHFSGDVIRTFERLFFDILAPGGWYVIEDVHMSYLSHAGFWYRLLSKVVADPQRPALDRFLRRIGLAGAGLCSSDHRKGAMVGYFKALVDAVNLHGELPDGSLQEFHRNNPDRAVRWVGSVHFYRRLIAVRKNI